MNSQGVCVKIQPCPKYCFEMNTRQQKMPRYKYNRQKSLGNYIVDFYYSKLSWVIELAG